MKKIMVLLFALFVFMPVNLAFADEEIYTNKEIMQRRQLIQEVGYKILNTNRIDERMTFEYNHYDKTVNAYATHRDRTIVLTKGMMNSLDTEDELAAILGHEISHAIDSYKGLFKGYFTCFKFLTKSRRDETRADVRSVDFVVNAGYNPVAILIVENKIMSQPRYEWYSTHPLSSKRMAKVYETIFQKYPYFLVNNEYINNPIYQNFLLTSKDNRLKLKDAVEKKKRTGKFKQPQYK